MKKFYSGLLAAIFAALTALVIAVIVNTYSQVSDLNDSLLLILISIFIGFVGGYVSEPNEEDEV
jgi:H+/Cl- antiporter ClcA